MLILEKDTQKYTTLDVIFLVCIQMDLKMDEEFKGHDELNTEVHARFSSKCPNSLVTLVL
jgi:hypothetical protein